MEAGRFRGGIETASLGFGHSRLNEAGWDNPPYLIRSRKVCTGKAILRPEKQNPRVLDSYLHISIFVGRWPQTLGGGQKKLLGNKRLFYGESTFWLNVSIERDPRNQES